MNTTYIDTIKGLQGKGKRYTGLVGRLLVMHFMINGSSGTVVRQMKEAYKASKIKNFK